MGKDRKFHKLRKQINQIARETKSEPAPKWRVVLSRIGFRRQYARWLIRAEQRRRDAIKYAVKQTAHGAVERSV